jgi:hypothetical protein
MISTSSSDPMYLVGLADGSVPSVSFEVMGHTYTEGYYLADWYLSWLACFYEYTS